MKKITNKLTSILFGLLVIFSSINFNGLILAAETIGSPTPISTVIEDTVLAEQYE